MNKLSERFNIGFSIYQAIGGLVFTSLGFYALGRWLYKILMNQAEFQWLTFSVGFSLCVFSGTITFIIIKLGLEQLKK